MASTFVTLIILVLLCCQLNCCNGKKGVTFVLEAHLPKFGVAKVGCGFTTPGTASTFRHWCNAYSGDTDCETFLPVLCVKVNNSPRPPYPSTDKYDDGWNLGHLSTSTPVKGSQFVNRAAVDDFCAISFGSGWRAATFHDGFYIPGAPSGEAWTAQSDRKLQAQWHYHSYADIRNDTRFWIHIRDQPATCWNQ